jgi:flavin reductase (DIM6/NTAB) family NADH-FMN oxidoreductase RutF
MKKPWNLINTPVYSLATYSNDIVNMNICTYVSAVSMQPKKYMIAVYENTKTLDNLLQSDVAVLQLLHSSQYGLVKTLGYKKGMFYNKQSYMLKKDLLENWEDYQVLKNASARVLLQKIWHQQAGDHTMFLFNVIKYKSYFESCLTLDTLRQYKLIRI